MANNSLVSKGSSKTGNGNGKNGHSTLYSLPTLYRGIYNRVAEKVGCDPSYVSRVARGERIGLIIRPPAEKQRWIVFFYGNGMTVAGTWAVRPMALR